MTNLKKDIENVSKDHVDKIEEMNKIVDLVEIILYFHNEDQTPNQILSKFPTFLAQLKTGNN